MYIDKLIKKEVITLLVSVSLLVIIFIGVTYAKFLSVDKGQDTVVNMGDLNISFCKDTTCDSTYTNIGQVIGTKIENGVSVPSSIYPFKNDGSYSKETPYIFKVENTGSLDSTVKIKLKEDTSFTPSGDYSDYARLTSKYASHLKVAIKKRILYKDTGYQLGDVNMDGIVNYDDIETLSRILSKQITPTDLQIKLADIDNNGKITAREVTYLSQMINGSIINIHSSHIYTYIDLEDGVIFKDDVIKSGESAIYFLWLYLDNTTPNDAQKTYFVGNIDIEGEYIPSNEVYCYYGGELTQGAEYINGQYTYRYKQEGKYSTNKIEWSNITTDGWGVQLTDKTSTAPVTSKTCTYIDGKPIVSMANMYSNSKATSIDTSKLNTQNIYDMSDMFAYLSVSTINISSLNTNKVENMYDMFAGNNFSSLDLSNFDTSNVTDMSYMFAESTITNLDLSKFNTKKVTSMEGMFSEMGNEILDLSSFSSDNLETMDYMFAGSSNLKTIYVPSIFVETYLNNIVSGEEMFTECTNLVGGANTKYDENNVDISYAIIDGGTDSPGYFTDIADKNIPAPNSFSTDSWKTVAKAAREGNLNKYNVGDTRSINLGTTYGTHTVRVANTSTPSECSTSGFSQSACGLVLEFTDIVTTGSYNDFDLLDKIYNNFPTNLKSLVIDTFATYSSGLNSSLKSKTTKLYSLAPREIYSNYSVSGDNTSNTTRQLDYYSKNNVSSSSNYTYAIKGNSTWWTRVDYSMGNYGFYRVVSETGAMSTLRVTISTPSQGISPAFRVG